jgi:class 3 adenylate cyclase
MTDGSNRTLVCSIAFLDIVEYSKKPVAEQMALKQSFNALVGNALAPVAARDRVVLDTGDGAAITFLGDPEDALAVTMAIRNGVHGALRVRMGINLGPVRLVRDINGQLNIIGDGINVAQRVMSFAGEGQLLVSRSFYEVVSRLSCDYERLFSYLGARTDKHVRAHEVYVVGAGRLPERAADTSPPRATGAAAALGALIAPGPFGLLRVTFLVAPLVFAAIVAGAAQMKSKRDMFAELEPPAADAKPARPAAARAAEPAPAAKVAAAPASAAAGKVQLVILPWGEVLVNGRSRGVSPPLKVLELPAGSHTIEVRNTNFPPHVARVTVRAGEQVPVRHRFR